MFRVWSNEAVIRYSGPIIDYDGRPIATPARTPADSDKILTFWLKASDAGWGFRWAVCIEPTNRFVGHIGFNSLGRYSEIAYHLHPEVWGQGVMSRAMELALGWAFGQPACVAVEAYIESENAASIKLVERFAFRATREFHDGARRHVLKRTELPVSPVSHKPNQ